MWPVPDPSGFDLARQLAIVAQDHVEDPPRGDAPVVRFATPDQLVAAFEPSVGLALGGDAPAHDAGAVLEAAEVVLRHSVHTSHPRFLNQNFAGAAPVAVVGDWLAAALNTANSTFEIAPVFHLLESALLAKLANLVGYPGAEPDGPPAELPPGLFCPGGSVARLYALQLARHRLQPDLVWAGAGPGAGQPAAAEEVMVARDLALVALPGARAPVARRGVAELLGPRREAALDLFFPRDAPSRCL